MTGAAMGDDRPRTWFVLEPTARVYFLRGLSGYLTPRHRIEPTFLEQTVCRTWRLLCEPTFVAIVYIRSPILPSVPRNETWLKERTIYFLTRVNGPCILRNNIHKFLNIEMTNKNWFLLRLVLYRFDCEIWIDNWFRRECNFVSRSKSINGRPWMLSHELRISLSL